MSRITITFLVGLLILLLSFGLMGLSGVSEEFVYMINEIPLFRPFVELVEGAVNIETGNPVTSIEPANDFLTVIIIALLMGFIKKVVDWVMNAFEAKGPLDRITIILNKVLWNFIISMGTVFFVSIVLDSFYSYLEDKTNAILAGVIAVVIVVFVIVVSSLFEVYVHHQRAGIIFIYLFVLPILKFTFISLIFAFAFSGIKMQMYSVFGILVLAATALCIVADILRSQFINKISKVKEN